MSPSGRRGTVAVVQTPFGEIPDRDAARMTMADMDAALRRPLSRRRLLQGAAVTGAAVASPMLWVKTGWAAVAPAGTHLTFGADPTRQAVVSWGTSSTVAGPVLDLGTDRSYGLVVPVESRAVRGTSTVYHHARLSQLRPDTTYHYRVRHQGAVSPDRTFRTAPSSPTAAFRFTAFGDQGVGADAAANTARIAAEKPAFHVHAGDLCYANSTGSGGDSQTFDSNVWDSWFAQNLPVAQAGIPWMPTVGNHEMEPGMGPQGYDGFLGRFTLPRNGVAGALNTYWFRYGNVAVVAMDGNDASYEIAANRGWLGTTQDAWLRATLSSLRADPAVDFIVAAFHNCMFCTNAVHGSDGGVRSRFEPVFDEFAVDLVVNGHNHSYERTHPRKGGASTAQVPPGGTVRPAEQGTTYVVAGGGGKTGYPVSLAPSSYVVDEDGNRGPELADWSAIHSEEYNLLVADVVPLTAARTTTMKLRAIQPDGTVIDTVTLERPAKAGLRKAASTAATPAPSRAPAGGAAAPTTPAGEQLPTTGADSGLLLAGTGLIAGAAALAAASRRAVPQ
jgi:hypothetical protein